MKPEREAGIREQFEKYVTPSQREGLWSLWQQCWLLASRAGAEAQREPDVFDWVGEKMAQHLVDTAMVIDRLQGPFRSGGITALEEFWFRATGKHFDWEESKVKLKAIRSAPIEGEK